MKQNQDYKNEALAALKGNWAPAVLANIVLVVIIGVIIGPYEVKSFGVNNPANLPWALMGTTNLLSILVLFPLTVGYYNAFKQLLNTGDNRLTANMFNIGFNNWLRNVWGYVLMAIFTFLWCLLLLIPGLIKAYAYALTPYLLVDRPELSANEAINESQRLMSGHKFDLFYLDLSFIGWYILGIFTLGIAYLWIVPYHYTARASFYADILANDQK